MVFWERYRQGVGTLELDFHGHPFGDPVGLWVRPCQPGDKEVELPRDTGRRSVGVLTGSGIAVRASPSRERSRNPSVSVYQLALGDDREMTGTGTGCGGWVLWTRVWALTVAGPAGTPGTASSGGRLPLPSPLSTFVSLRAPLDLAGV